jgi:uncharacterized membrane protein
MSDLIAIAYDDLDQATQVSRTIGELQKSHVVELVDSVIVERRDNGKIKLHQSRPLATMGAASGALWGGLIGLLFMVPLLGVAIGGAAGAAGGALSDYGIEDDFMREVGERLQPGNAALFLLVAKSTPDKLIPELAKYGGHVMQTSLSDEAEEQLREATEARSA